MSYNAALTDCAYDFLAGIVYAQDTLGAVIDIVVGVRAGSKGHERNQQAYPDRVPPDMPIILCLPNTPEAEYASRQA
jgi:hypothetical protein